MSDIRVDVLLDPYLAKSVGADSYSITGNANDKSIMGQILTNKTYEPHMLKTINDILPAGGTFIDVGANIGVISIFASLKAGACGKILSIEASPTNYEYLKQNICMNSCENATAINMGVWNESAQMDFHYVSEVAGCSFFSTTGVSVGEIQSVTCNTLDNILSKNKIEKINVIKIDVEGAELKALIGAKNTIQEFKPKILMEINPTTLKRFFDTELQDIYDKLKSYKYNIKLVHDNGDTEIIGSYHKLHEIFLTSKGWEDVLCEHEEGGRK
jgi:FkbM family methyltransferase